ncbi:GCK domain-containing protein [Striga asiatica]|uniref:GCK domain-containing protein n=1 Tax=Striga asiatica TaxID=4170 RepID=A0A5A7QTG6_STRAF|nr:GCK domain-containing protein [Striga asiatica]
MGDLLSKSSQPDSTATSSSPTDAVAVPMPSPNSELSQASQTPESKTPTEKSIDPPSDPATAQVQPNAAETETLPEGNTEESTKDGDNVEEVGDEEEEEEEGECGFCLFMKGGGCKEPFIEWEKCVEEGETNKEDIVEKCFQETAALKKCMEAHSDYYAPLLQAEKAAEEEAARQLEQERENSKEVSVEKEAVEEKLGGDEKNSA